MGKGRGWHNDSKRHADAARGIKTTSLQNFLFNRYRKELWEKTQLQLRKLTAKHVNDYGIGPASGIDSVLVLGSFATMGRKRPNDVDVAIFRKDRPSRESNPMWRVVTESTKLDVIQSPMEDRQQDLDNWAKISQKKYGEIAFIDVTQDVLKRGSND